MHRGCRSSAQLGHAPAGDRRHHQRHARHEEVDPDQQAEDPKRARTNGRRARHETELETVRQEAAVAISSRDAQIQEQDQQIEKLTKQIKPALDSACDADADTEETDHAGAEHPKHKEDADSAGIVQYVVTMCGADQEKIREVIAGLSAYLEQRVS